MAGGLPVDQDVCVCGGGYHANFKFISQEEFL